MKETIFVSRNEEHWKALESCNSRLRLRGGIKKVDTEEVREFARLFRLTGFHLAYAKTHYPGGNTVQYLNRLVGVSHNFFYVREKSDYSTVRLYFAHTLPQTVRETWRYWTAAMAVFVLGMLLAGFYVAGETSRLAEILPAGMAYGFSPDEAPDFGGGEVIWDGSLMTAFFITNNTAVAINAFAWGLLLGIGSLFIMFFNGLVVGALFGFFHAVGADMLIAYSLVLPHGVLELAALFLAGGGGLMLGKGLLIPGEYTRAHSLIIHGKKAVQLIPAIAIMLFIAAFIEGFFTPLPISPWFKLAFAGLTGVGMVAYFMKGVRRR